MFTWAHAMTTSLAESAGPLEGARPAGAQGVLVSAMAMGVLVSAVRSSIGVRVSDIGVLMSATRGPYGLGFQCLYAGVRTLVYPGRHNDPIEEPPSHELILGRHKYPSGRNRYPIVRHKYPRVPSYCHYQLEGLLTSSTSLAREPSPSSIATCYHLLTQS